MELNGTKCALRPWRLDDAESLAAYANNRTIARNMLDHFPHPYTVEAAHEWLVTCAEEAPPHTKLAITTDDGEAIGGTGFSVLPDVQRTTARAGYWLGEPFWGHGIVTEAFALLTGYIFDTFPGVHRVEATVFEWNPASCRVLEKCGFTQEARMRKACIKDGEVFDLFLYARVRGDCPRGAAGK